MTTRTELIARLRHYQKEFDYDPFYKDVADMLEADEQGMKDAFASGMSCRPASVQQCDKLQSAARLALEYLKMYQQYGPPMAFGNTTVFDAITALREALK